MYRKIAAFVHSYRWPILLALLLVTGITGAAIFRLEIDPSMEALFNKNTEEYRYYREYSEKYGSDQMVAIAMATPNLFQVPMLRKLEAITEDIADFENVERVTSLANAMDIRPKFIGVKTVPALEGVIEGDRPLEEAKWNILNNELFVNNIISRDGKVANILVYLTPSGKDHSLSGRLIKKLRAYLDTQKEAGVEFYMAGSPVEQYDFINLIRRDQFTFVPLITLLLIATTFLIYRSFTCMLLAMSIVFMTLVWTMGTIALLGDKLNLMTSLLAPVIMIVAVVNSIYLMNVFFEIRPHQPSLKAAIIMTMHQLAIPCLLTHFTAMLGFAALGLSPVPAIRSFGLYAALGTGFSYVVELILTPILFPMLPYRYIGERTEKVGTMNRVLVHFIEKLDLRWKYWIIAFTVLSVGLAVLGITKIEVDTNIVKQMRPDLPLAVSTRFIDEHVTGVYSLGFVFRRRNGETFVDYETLKRLDSFKTYLESLKGISKVNSITTVIKKIHEARSDNEPGSYKIPESQDDLDRYFRGLQESKDKNLDMVISRDLKEIRLEARMKALGTREGAEVEAAARDYLDSNMTDKFEYHLTGSVVLLGKMAKGLVHEQAVTFGFAFFSILIVIIILFRSIPLGLLAAIPNLIPITLVYGLMGFMRIELSTPTAMISSIVLGMVVDASIQFLYRFRLEFQYRRHYLQSLHHTCLNMGQSMVISTLILCVGFASSASASFRPTVHFGVLTSLTIFLALICTLLVLPVCIIILRPFGRQRLFSPKHKASAFGGDFSIQQKYH